MPSRAVEAALLAAVGIAATALAFTLLKPYLFPQRAIKLEMIRDNVENLATILDKKGGRFTPQATYLVQTEGARFYAEIRVKDSNGEVIWNTNFALPLPTANVTLDEKRSPFILRGSISPYANATAPTIAFVDGAKVEVILRPTLHVEDCEYYGLKCKRVSINIPVLQLELSGKPASQCVFTRDRVVDIYLNKSAILPPELKYGKELLISMKILDLNNNVKEILSFRLERELQLDLQENGVFLIQYVLDNIVVKC
jgi:hypothetical protein